LYHQKVFYETDFSDTAGNLEKTCFS